MMDTSSFFLMVLNNIYIAFQRIMIITGIILSGLFCFASCDDKIMQTIKDENTLIPPKPGGHGIITLKNITSQSAIISWQQSADNNTPSSELQYNIMYSMVEPIVFVEDIQKADFMSDWIKNINTFELTELLPDSTYYITIAVKDVDEQLVLYNTLSIKTPASIDMTPPIPGNGGVISTSSISKNSITLHWVYGSDVVTPMNDLQYILYQSEKNDISTYREAVNNGVVRMDWSEGANSYLVNRLSSDTLYYFSVFVKDKAGNIAAYEVIQTKTLMNRPDKIYLFSAGAFQGNMAQLASSARNKLDSICSSSRQYKALSCSTTHAFISISRSDQISNMDSNFSVPVSVPIMGPGDVTIAYKWTDLFDEDLLVPLEKAGILSGFWWSGSDSNGNAIRDNCSSWQDGTNRQKGRSGAHDRINIEWLESKSRNCNNSLHLLCLCW